MTRGPAGRDGSEFDQFAGEVRPRLVRAFVPSRGVDGAADATAEALAYAFEHWDEVRSKANQPVGCSGSGSPAPGAARSHPSPAQNPSASPTSSPDSCPP